MENIIFRNANINDLPFLVDTIIAAEKSGTEILSYSTVFGLTEEDARKYIAAMLQEEVDGCELSVSSFLLAEVNGEIAASIAAWVEGSAGVSSTVLKGNLLNFTLPKKCIERAILYNDILKDLNFEYFVDTIQIGVVYVTFEFRGKNLSGLLIDQQLSRLTKKYTNISTAYVQVFGNNLNAIKAYEKAGFSKQSIKESSTNEVLKLLPSGKKILMKKDLLIKNK